ncbi:MAG: glycosyltransferase [Rhodocyclaceae bacterium]|nr:glycosyltransferase [Rhodocyclaceae bacterium]
MNCSRNTIHIVADFVNPGGGEAHARALGTLLTPLTHVRYWSDEPLNLRPQYDISIIRPYSGEYPRGGTLIVLGPHRRLSPWINYCNASRVIVVCNASEPGLLFRQLAQIRNAALPEPEISFVSKRLCESIGIGGTINISPVDVESYTVAERPIRRPVVGRHSRDIVEKHHPADMSLYMQFLFKGLDVQILGGACLRHASSGIPDGLSLLAYNHQSSYAFLPGLDIYFYRTNPILHEAAGRCILEAMASGLPIVASTTGGYTDWINDGENGYLVTNQDEAYDRVLLLANDPVLRRKIGYCAAQTAVQLSGRHVREKITAWYLGEGC